MKSDNILKMVEGSNIEFKEIIEPISQIHQLVYKLYDLTPEEINIVEGFNDC